MFLDLSLICGMYSAVCMCLIGWAELSVVRKYEDPTMRDVVLDMLTSKVYIVWFLPWWILFVIWRLAQTHRDRNRAQAEHWNRNVV